MNCDEIELRQIETKQKLIPEATEMNHKKKK